MVITLNEMYFSDPYNIPASFSLLYPTDNRSNLDQWSESERQLQLWNTRSNQCLWLIQYELKECCLSICLWWHVEYNCKPLHGGSPNLPRQMTYLLRLLVCANFFHSQLKPASSSSPFFFFSHCLTVYWCFATAVMTCINSVLEIIGAYPTFCLGNNEKMWCNGAKSTLWHYLCTGYLDRIGYLKGSNMWESKS